MTDTRELVKEVREAVAGRYVKKWAGEADVATNLRGNSAMATEAPGWLLRLCDAVEQLEGEQETNVLVLGHVKTERAELTTERDHLREANAKLREGLAGIAQAAEVSDEVSRFAMGRMARAALKPVDTGRDALRQCIDPDDVTSTSPAKPDTGGEGDRPTHSEKDGSPIVYCPKCGNCRGHGIVMTAGEPAMWVCGSHSCAHQWEMKGGES